MRTLSRRWLLLLLVAVLLMAGCRHEAAYEKGFGYTFTPHPIMFGARMESDLFDRDAVTLDIYYGVHDMGYDEKYDHDPRTRYRKEGYETIFFGLYTCAGEHQLDVVNDMQIPDYRNIPNYYFVREIGEEEAFSGEYGFTMGYWRGITYNHKETITIPAELLTGTRGSIAVRLVAFHEPLEEGGPYYTSTAGGIELDYQLQEDGRIQIIL